MSTISTVGLPFSMAQGTSEEIRAYLPEEEGSTTPLASELEAEGYALDIMSHAIRSFMARASRAIMPSDRSQPIDSELFMPMQRYKKDQEEVADFFEPVTFNWDQDVFEVREAVRRYSEQIHADY